MWVNHALKSLGTEHFYSYYVGQAVVMFNKWPFSCKIRDTEIKLNLKCSGCCGNFIIETDIKDVCTMEARHICSVLCG